MFFVTTRGTRCKPGLILLLSGGAIACAYAALNVDYRQVVHGFRRAVGTNGPRHFPATGRLQIGGKFRVNDLDGFVAALGVTHGVRATLSDPDGPVIRLSGGHSSGSAEIEGAPGR